MSRPSNPRRPCPVCKQVVAVKRIAERIFPHHWEGSPCPGSDNPVDLYDIESLPTQGKVVGRQRIRVKRDPEIVIVPVEREEE